MRSLLGRFHRPFARSAEEQLLLLNNLGDGSTLSLDFTTGVLDPRLTFTRDGGGTYTGNDGLVYGVDFATSGSLAIGTGSKSVTLTATANVDRRYLVGQTVWISNGANNMRGPVTAYNASTQVLTINATGTSGSGSFTSWTVGNASARFDYDPTAIGTPRGLLIEASANNLCLNSEDFSAWNTANTSLASESGDTNPDGSTVPTRVSDNSTNGEHYRGRTPSLTTATTYTKSVWFKNPATNGRRYGGLQLFAGGGTDTGGVVAVWDFDTGQSVSSLTFGYGGKPTPSVSCVPYKSGWYRVSISMTVTGTLTALNHRILLSNGTATSYANSGTALGLLVWGAQLETGSGASSYIPTGASQGNRAADSLVIQDGAWRNTANIDSTWYVDGALNKMNTAFNSVFDVVGNVGFTERNRVFISATGSQVRFTHFARSASVNPDFEYAINQASPNGYVYGSRFKVAATFDNTAGENRSSWNGATSNGSTAAACTTTPTYFTITVGSGNDWHYRSIKYWPFSLPQTTLNGITTL